VALLLPLAFVSGLATALSPCVLPALPVVLAGAAGGGRRRLAGIALGFVAAFVAITLALAAALRAVGLDADALRWVAVAALVAFGLALAIRPLDARLAGLLGPAARLGDRIPRTRGGLGGGLLVGVALGLVWTPCAGPIFAAIAAVAATDDVGPAAVAVLTAYALGAIVPLVAVAHGGRRLAARLGPGAGAARPALGIAMVAVGVVVALGLDTRLTTAVTRDVPGYTGTLQAFERSGPVARRLDELRGIRGPAPFVAAARGSRPAPGDDLGLPDAGPAPELRGVTAEFNTGGEPLTLASLRGRVVLLDFWTYSCVNCLRTIPELTGLDARYRAAGLTVLGVHTPEFAFEADPGNVGRAVRELGIRYPVVLDPDFATWDAFRNVYWPTTYLIDRDGRVRDLHVGEGDEGRTEEVVRRALGLAGDGEGAAAGGRRTGHRPITPETFLGRERLRRLPPPDRLAFRGGWTVTPEYARAGAGAALEVRFRARDVFLVLDGAGAERPARVLLDGRPVPPAAAGADVGPGGALAAGEPRLYRLLHLPRRGAGLLRVELAPGTRAYSFTFG
jgi:cytochrome c biogenesis protein CcdA/thiol-disulfide isomerase/thioredoxin